ncbi:DUF3278 domain-containing protein [Liquorilactobacillus capillatus]|uniref:DUF3278 domain-containing protein n=1 Tax=Liquorilactobacillus capillatus DSM 19910 TaxID=1423731 RepID=A0A0R1M402_9LACO|nr:DUF3278 domain-containing protein [Liquorilactobacillus capillatus]KRL02481.1 hypothetical protein FC81_GL000825 [Liquorilactobacillus capillatus DSM 19910]
MSKKLVEKIIKHFYGIDGILDECKKEQLNKFGNIAFIIIWWYLLISGFVAILLSVNNLTMAVQFLIAGNLLVALVGIFSVIWFLRKKRLDVVEIDKNEYPKQKKRYLRKSIGLSIYFGVCMYIFSVLTDTVMESKHFWQSISSVDNIYTAIFQGVGFGVCMYIFYIIKLKK